MDRRETERFDLGSLESTEKQITQKTNPEILTIEKVLRERREYNQIIFDIKKFLFDHKIVFSDDDVENGVSLTNTMFGVETNSIIQPTEYKNLQEEWWKFKREKGIPATTAQLGRFFYCKGKEGSELVKKLDIGYGILGQKTPENYINVICPN